MNCNYTCTQQSYKEDQLPQQCEDLLKRHTVYSMDEEPCDELELCPTRIELVTSPKKYLYSAFLNVKKSNKKQKRWFFPFLSDIIEAHPRT